MDYEHFILRWGQQQECDMCQMCSVSCHPQLLLQQQEILGRAPVDKGLDVVHVELLAVAVGEEGVLVATSAPVHILQQPHRK